MDVRLLGPLEARDGQELLALGPPKQRALLARLLLDAGRTVSVERLIDDLWGDELPQTAAKMVQIYVSGLRKALGPERLLTRPPGYSLELAAGDDVDLLRFERLVARGRTALAGGDRATAAALLREALGLWRGPALAEFLPGPFARGEGDRLEELRLAVLEDRIEADLGLGRAGELAGELEALVGQHPLRERLREQHMLALYRAGRHGEALAAYRAFRDVLDDQLGIGPSARLRALEQSMLEQDPALDVRPAAAPPPAPAVAAPPGRTDALAQLLAALAEAAAGSRRLVLVTGEPGMGKSTLVRALLDAAGPALAIAGRCAVGRGPGEAYLPLLDGLAGAATADPQVAAELAARAPSWLPELPSLTQGGVAEPVPGVTRERMLREMLELLEALASERPVVLVLEDAEWADSATLELLAALMARRRPARLLVVATAARPVELMGDLRLRGVARELVLEPLGPEAAGAAFGLDGPTAARLAERGGGNPLFIRCLADHEARTGSLQDAPETLPAALHARLAAFGEDQLGLLRAAAVEGTEFTAAGVEAALRRPAGRIPDGDVTVALGPVHWPDGTSTEAYAFAHEAYRDALLETIEPERRAELHRRLGERLEDAFGPHGPTAQEIALHHLDGGRPGAAVRFLRLAAAECLARRADHVRIAHLERALSAAAELPPGAARVRTEVGLLSELGQAHVAVTGWSSPDALAALERARALGEGLEDREPLATVLLALATLREVRGEPAPALEAVGAGAAHADHDLEGNELVACALFHKGAFDRALSHADLGAGQFEGGGEEAQYTTFPATLGDNAGAACHDWAALSLWFLGRPEEAVERAARALELCEDPARAHGAAAARAQMAALRACRGEPEQTLRWAQAAIDAGRERGYAYRVAMGRLLRGWALAAGGREDGAAEIAAGLEAARATGARLEDPFFLGLLADAHLRGGSAEAGLAAVEEALAIAERERAHFFDAELRRLRGELLLAAGRPREDAESSLREALAVARRQGARSLELRAALALARLAAGGPGEAEARAGLRAALEALAGDDGADARAASALLAGDRSQAGDGVSRRRITVLAWEVDGLGELAECAEPERLLEVVGACHAAARDAVAGAGGHVATEDESGGLIYFGFPQAVENAPQRAVRSGLALAEALATEVDGVALRVCAGVHIGAAVIGPVGDAELAMGRAPRTAWHLAAAAPPGELLVSDTTRELCARDFEFAAHGAGHRVTGEIRAGRSAEPGPSPLVGREPELALLRGRWEQAAEGLGQVVQVSGEAGIGKSRLVRELAAGLDPAAQEILELRCRDGHAASALHPVAEHFRWRTAERGGGAEALLAHAGVPVAEAAPVVSALLAGTDGAGRTPEALVRRVVEVVAAYVLAPAERGPVLVVVEDLHWADPSTLELIRDLADAVADARVLLVVTLRPGLRVPWGPSSHLSQIPLGRCSPAEAEAIAGHTVSAPLAPEAMRAVVERGGGVPLFVEELARAAECGDAAGLPASLQDLLMSRLERLTPVAREVARLGATIGQEFGHTLLAAASPLPAAELERALAELTAGELLRRRGRPPMIRYAFRHALLGEAAGESAPDASRRAMHLQVATAMERSLPELGREDPDAVAGHLEAAGEPRRAIAYRLDAGRIALARSAATEAADQLTRGIEDLAALGDERFRDELELELRVPLGNALLSSRGYGSTEAASCYARARELCARTGNDASLLPVLYGLWVNGFVRAHLERVLTVGREMRRIAERRDPGALSVAERAVGWPLVCMGRFEEAREHLDRIPGLYDAGLHGPLRFRFGQDPGSSGLATGAWALWGCGETRAAEERAEAAIALARETDHPLSVAYALGTGALLAAFMGDAATARERALAAHALTREFHLPLWQGWSSYALGWAELDGGDPEGAARTVRSGLEAARGTGAVLFEPFALTVLAEAEARSGDAEAAREYVRAAADAADAAGERFVEPHTRRVRAQLLAG